MFNFKYIIHRNNIACELLNKCQPRMSKYVQFWNVVPRDNLPIFPIWAICSKRLPVSVFFGAFCVFSTKRECTIVCKFLVFASSRCNITIECIAFYFHFALSLASCWLSVADVRIRSSSKFSTACLVFYTNSRFVHVIQCLAVIFQIQYSFQYSQKTHLIKFSLIGNW